MSQEKSPLVSIVSLTYNHEKYISECIDSVLSQSYSNWEMLIMDDGSTDKTGEIVKDYAQKDTRIKYHHQENVGAFRMSETYNKGLHLSSGEFVAILECDDVWFPYKLEKQVKSLVENEDCILAWGNAYNSRENIQDILKTQPDKEQRQFRPQFGNDPIGCIARSIYFANYLPALTLVIRRNSLIEIGGFQTFKNLSLVDHPTLLQLCFKGKFFYDETVLGTYRRHPSQITKKHAIEAMESMRQFVYHHYSSLSIEQQAIVHLSRQEIENKFHSKEMAVRSVFARRSLIAKEYTQAREQYLKVIFFPHTWNILWRLRSFIGLIVSYLGMDVEGIAKILGKRYYR